MQVATEAPAGLAVPGSQAIQAELEVLPVFGLYVSTGQFVHEAALGPDQVP